jgi:hypothetical protein
MRYSISGSFVEPELDIFTDKYFRHLFISDKVYLYDSASLDYR